MQQAINAADPKRSLPHYLPPAPRGRTIVVGAGKAAASMVQAFEDHWPHPLTGLVVTRYGHKVPTRFVEVVEASHPVPDQSGLEAAERILQLVTGLTEEDLVVCLISGGGSALLTAPAPGLSLKDKQAINAALLKSGATIDEMNCVRKHLSAIKGGQLALACAPAKVWTLLISDVPGDDPSVIASGPTVADPTTFKDALAIIEKYRITEPLAVIEHLRAAKKETPKPGDTRLASNQYHLIATPQMSLEAAAKFALEQGITPLILGDSLEGEARDMALIHAGITKQVLRHAQPIARPCLLLSGGESTVTVRGSGRGGRNTEFLLALSVALGGMDNVFALACDTDGVDGTEDNAGALITPDTLTRAERLGLSAKAFLANNDGYSFFQQLNDLVITGPTLTNVNDFRAILIL
ncbi:MAG: glycerate kinase [Betaproteobacteria bacterium]|nr:glycerate kinase [Betaproteobacteria bacterium]MDE2422911.1 glycerate kinase [Betaproteobacteria bacterium]